MTNLFLSYKFNSIGETFANKIYFILKKQKALNILFWKYSAEPGDFTVQLRKMIKNSEYFIFFWGKEIGKLQIQEVGYAIDNRIEIIPIKLPNYQKPKNLRPYCDLLQKLESSKASILVTEEELEKINKAAINATKDLIENKLKKLNLGWIPEYFLPNGYPFSYEKDIIKEFIEGKGRLGVDRVKEGCPQEWPEVDREIGNVENPIPEEDCGRFRDGKYIMPAALSDYHFKEGGRCLFNMGLTFPEAGPRKFLFYPNENETLNVGILVSGGIAPGINSVISGIIKRHIKYDLEGKNPHNNLKIYGYMEGFKTLLGKVKGPRYKTIYQTGNKDSIVDTFFTRAEEGGSIIPTSRADDLLSEEEREWYFANIMNALDVDHINILYIIGGDGSMKAAHALQNYAMQMDKDLAVIGVPKTMDNDILWVWQSFGFLSAVEWAKGAIRQIYTEVKSNPRICIVQLFGSDSGFVVTHAALASGVCDLVLIPEQKFKTEKVNAYILKKLQERFAEGTDGKSPYGIILLAETALPVDAEEFVKRERDKRENKTKKRDKNNEHDDDALTWKEIIAVEKFFHANCRVKGQTPDELRIAGLKILTLQLKKALADKAIKDKKNKNRTKKNSASKEELSYWETFRVFTNEPRHLIRSIPPSSSDIIFGERLGTLAVDGAMAGFRDFMISQWLTEYVMVPLELVVLGRKRIPKDGIFWKSVISATGQPSNLL
jgi:6-phosphofructokinase 1